MSSCCRRRAAASASAVPCGGCKSNGGLVLNPFVHSTFRVIHGSAQPAGRPHDTGERSLPSSRECATARPAPAQPPAWRSKAVAALDGVGGIRNQHVAAASAAAAAGAADVDA